LQVTDAETPQVTDAETLQFTDAEAEPQVANHLQECARIVVNEIEATESLHESMQVLVDLDENQPRG
jgi:hypothetical protein